MGDTHGPEPAKPLCRLGLPTGLSSSPRLLARLLPRLLAMLPVLSLRPTGRRGLGPRGASTSNHSADSEALPLPGVGVASCAMTAWGDFCLESQARTPEARNQ